MKIKQKCLLGLITTVLSLSFVLAPAISVNAATCAGVDTSVLECDEGSSSTSDITQTGLWQLLISILNIVTAGVGVVAVGGVVYGGVLYTTARGKPEQTKKAVTVISNVGIGLVMYALMWSFLNYLIPGGIFT